MYMTPLSSEKRKLSRWRHHMGLPGISYGNVTKITSFCKLILLWGLVKIMGDAFKVLR
jgi:hypothetical protein